MGWLFTNKPKGMSIKEFFGDLRWKVSRLLHQVRSGHVFTITYDPTGNALPEPVGVRVVGDGESVLIGVTHAPAFYDDVGDEYSYRIVLRYACPVRDRPPEELWSAMLSGPGAALKEGWEVNVWADGDDEEPLELFLRPMREDESHEDGAEGTSQS